MSVPALLKLNPELQRNLWLEFSLTRLLAMPAALFVLLGGIEQISDKDVAARTTTFVLGALLMLWGSRLSAESFGEEVANRTWDVQRLSALSPWAVTLGKLVGGTAYVWYGALLCVPALLLFAPDTASETLCRYAVGGLIAQGSGLLSIMLLYRLGGGARRGYTTVAQIIGLVVGIWAVGGASAAVQAQGGGSLLWYGMLYPRSRFILALQLVFAGWLAIGVMRLIRSELGYVDGPLGWCVFTIYVCFVAAGFAAQTNEFVSPLLAMLSIASALGAVLTYAALLGTPISPVGVKRLVQSVSAGYWRSVWHDLPIWVPSAVVACGLAIVVGALVPEGQGALFNFAFIAATIGFLVRDIGLFYLVRLSYRRRTTLALLILFGVLYLLLPRLFSIRVCFIPVPPGSLLGIVPPWVEAAAVGIALYRRFIAVTRAKTREGGA